MTGGAVAVIFANLKGNIGDFAILHAMLRDLRRRFPGSAVHVYPHGHYAIDQRRLAAFSATSAEAFEIAGTTWHEQPRSHLAERFVRSARLQPVVQARRIRSLSERAGAQAARFTGYEAIFVAGGEHWGGSSGGISMFGTLGAVYRHNRRISAYPFSVSPRLESFNRRRDLQRYFAMLRAPLVARDSASREVLEGLGLPAVLGADCVYSLHDLASEVAPMPDRDHRRVLISVTGGRRRLEGELRGALQGIVDSGRRVALMTTCEPEDGSRGRAVAGELGIPFLAPLTWQEAVSEIKASALLVTNRLHGLILGSLAGAPLLPVTNRSKSAAFANDAQVPYSVPFIRALDAGLLERSLADRDAITKAVYGYRDQARNAPSGPLG